MLKDSPTNRDSLLVAEHAAHALEAIGPAARQQVPELVTLLKHRVHKKSPVGDLDALVRSGAAKALGSIGPEARAAVGPLVSALNDDVDYVRLAVAAALGKVCASEVPDGVARPNGKGAITESRG